MSPSAVGAPSPTTTNASQNSAPSAPSSEKISCEEGHPKPAAGMSTETFMALKSQSADNPQSMVEGLKEILKILALAKVLEALQQT
tara:strand:- start:1931 stop:2188 length:258 start_codon:yes stop_codon:yes gene_type:complete